VEIKRKKEWEEDGERTGKREREGWPF